MAPTNQSFRLSRPLEILLAVVVLLELIAPFTPNTYGLDGGSHLAWIREFTGLFTSGVFVPRWVPSAFSGFGAASFYIYPPLTYYISSLVRVGSGITDPSILYQLTGLIGTATSLFTCRWLLRSVSGERYLSTIGALLYAVAPLRLFDLYTRCSLSSHIAYTSIPLVWIGLVKVQRSPGLRSIAFLAVSSALLALTSVPLTIALSICVIPAAILCRESLTMKSVLATALSGVLAAALTAYLFFASYAMEPYPCLREAESFHSYFGLNSILSNLRSPEIYNFFLTVLLCGVICAGILITYRKERNSKMESRNRNKSLIAAKFSILCLALFFLIDSPYSSPIFSLFRPLQIMQFASRLWSEILLGVVVVISLAKTEVMNRTSHTLAWLLVLGAIGPAFMAAFNLHLNSHSEPLAIEVPVFRPIYTQPLNAFLKFVPEHANDPAFLSDLSDVEKIRPISRMNNSEEFEALFFAPHIVTFHRFCWPDWHLFLHDSEIHIIPDTLGRATAVLPKGNYRYHWRLDQAPLELAGDWISGIALLSMVIGMLFTTWRNRRA